MDGLFELLLVLLHRRVFISAISSITLTMVLSNFFESLTAGYCIILAFIGIGLGVYWQDRADIKRFKK
jgi:hypothetical protein